MVPALVAAIILLDQSVKWWAWRHIPAVINQGGDVLVGATISRWYADPVQGTLLDLLDLGVLSTALTLLWRRRHSLAVLITGGMMLGGWSSNLLDRLFMHYLTAPGSNRGAVDFMHLGRHYYNVADLFIIAGTPLFVLAVGAHWVAVALARVSPRPQIRPSYDQLPGPSSDAAFDNRAVRADLVGVGASPAASGLLDQGQSSR
ncbi:MAG: signal peptidase [Frankiales bacterium]|nr:signal peptidase [Frankiales bacterium]